MSHKKSLKNDLSNLIKSAVTEDGANVASAVNVGGSGKSTSVKSSKRIVQRDGVSTVTEEREERSEG